jgi:hypothetical protein
MSAVTTAAAAATTRIQNIKQHWLATQQKLKR